jgi:hypothetical protein
MPLITSCWKRIKPSKFAHAVLPIPRSSIHCKLDISRVAQQKSQVCDCCFKDDRLKTFHYIILNANMFVSAANNQAKNGSGCINR